LSQVKGLQGKILRHPSLIDGFKIGLQGYEAAKATGLEIIAVLQAATGDLGRIKQFVKVLGMVNCTPEYTAQPAVINGFSDLMVAVFGEKGKHARSAVGVGSLPNNMAVEIEVIVELEDR
jgi:enamine deaminase RidA (YjgF/YER057c/UK114 family)